MASWCRAAFERLFAAMLVVAASICLLTGPATALEPVDASSPNAVVDLKSAADFYEDRGGSFQVSTIPGPDGIVRRIEVDATSPQASGDWAVFALANESDEQIDRLVVAQHFRLVGSGVLSPDLGSQRIAAITPSQGFALEREASEDADVFRITLDPGSVVTLVAEMTSDELPSLRLWQAPAYKDAVNAFTLYRGIVLGIAGLLAVFLTILFVVKGSAVFPATAALAWAVLAYICIDFGFWLKLWPILPEHQPIARAGMEVALAATLIVFLYAYLSLNRWHGAFSLFAVAWLAGLVGVGALAVFDPSLAAGIARLSLGATGLVGGGVILTLAFQRFDRAIMLIPTWALVGVWLVGAWMTTTGVIDNEIVRAALGGGLVLIVLLIGFTIMQHAFAGGGLHDGLLSDIERRSLALSGSGDAVFDWDVTRDRITLTNTDEQLSTLPLGALNGPARDWLPVLHADDRDRFKLTLDTILQHRRGRITQEFRLRDEEGHYHWIGLKARPVLGSDGEVARCVGTLQDVTERRKAEERLLQDALHDQLTGLPNRELFLDRLTALGVLAGKRADVQPTVFVFDVDRFRQVNEDLGIATGDTILLTLGRRLKRLLKPEDTLARLSGDQFGLVLISCEGVDAVAGFADELREAIKAPIAFADREIVLTGSIGLTGWTEASTATDALKEAELAMYEAKRTGGDRIEPFRPAYRTAGNGRLQLESDLRRAFERNELTLAFQPIMTLEDETIVGFEALMRWDHPRRGAISPAEFIPIAESTGLIVQLGQFALEEAARRIAEWQRLAGDRELFVSVNISSRQLIRQDLIGDVEAVLKRYALAPESLKLELTESLVMDNPERSGQILERLREMGVGLSLDDFGTGHSSLAYLLGFPFDTLKLDQSFLRDSDEPQRPVIVQSIVGMAHDLGLKVVAEGVENQADVIQLRQLKCEFVQSFMFGAPADAEETRRRLRERSGALRQAS